MSQKKQIFKLNILKKLLADENSCVSLVKSTRLLGLPPFFLTDMKSGILYILNSMLKKYDRSLGGIVIGYQNIKVLMDENTGIIPIGTSEMEVNISVEFYIFQPKIGSYLEGVINKKSNNHIGCLVHQYFNATILKSEDVLYEDWICKDLNVDDRIIFKVKDLDFTTLLPYIEGIYDGRLSLDKVESNSSGNCDMDSMIAKNVNKSCDDVVSCPNDVLESRTNAGGVPDDSFLSSEKGEDLCNEELDTLNVNNNLREIQSFVDAGVRKKRKKKEKFLNDDNFKVNEEKSSNENEIIMAETSEKLQEDEIMDKKKKKKKKRKEEESNNEEIMTEVKNDEEMEEISTLLPSHVQGKILEIEDENSNDFIKTIKNKTGKKKKNKNEEPVPSFNKINECFPSQEAEDNVLYSTQLEPVMGSKKMRISFCSPIPHSAPFAKFEDKSITSSIQRNCEDNVDAAEKETKKKHKKRKREKQEESDDSPVSKKMKISSHKKEESEKDMNIDERMSFMKRMMEQVFQEQLSKVKEELNLSSSDKESVKEEKKKKKAKKKEREMEQNEISTKSQLNGEDGKSELLTDEFHELELQKAKEELSISDKESFKESKKKKAKVKKQEKEVSKEETREESCKDKESENAQINSVNGIENFDVRSMMEELFKQQINRVKEELRSYADKVIEKKKKKCVANTQEPSREKSHDSLYDKLLSDAKSAVVVEKISAPILPPAAEPGRKKKDSELSDASASSSRKKNSKKRNKRKVEDCEREPEYKNGSMYDVAPTPEKINPDKSLFSDSEQSHPSPAKKRKGVNGVEVESRKSRVQNMLDEFYKEEARRLKSDSDRESIKDSGKKSKKKSKTEEKSQVSGVKEESLYEKLLKQAKSMIDVRDSSLPIKKEKKGKKKKLVQDSVKS